MGELSVVGKRLPRIDAVEKVTGQARFGADFRIPGMLYGRILRSPHPHARVIHIDTSRAERLPGVRGVITIEDTPKKKFGVIIPDELPLAHDKVRFVGEEVAAVAAVDPEIAMEALSLIQVEYEPLPAVFDPLDALNPEAPRIHLNERNVASHIGFSRGDVEEGFRQSDYIFEDRYVTSAVHQTYIEPVTIVAGWDASGKLTVWAPVQDPFYFRYFLAKPLDINVGRIRVVQTSIGGGFGGKRAQRIYPICALLSRKAGKPVIMAHTRAEELSIALVRVPMIIDIKLGVMRDGKLLAKQARIVADNGAYTNRAPGLLNLAAIGMDSLYKFAHLKTDADLVYTNNRPTGDYRGFGNPQMNFALESHIDMVAHDLGIDPIELRLKNAVREGETTMHGWKISSSGFVECLESIAQKVGWRERKKDKHDGRGLGLACCIHVSGARSGFDYQGSTALVKMHEDGRATVISGEGEIGQGADTAFAQIAAEELGIAYEDVEVAPVDTDFSPFGLGAWATRVTLAGGNAVKAAAADAKRQLFEVAAEKLEANPQDLEIRDSRVYVKGSAEKTFSVAEIVQTALFRRGGSPIIGQGTYDPDTVMVDPKTRYGHMSPTYTFAAQVAEVEVDKETGSVRLLRLVAAHDVGKSINPMAVEGQIEGGVAQAVGYALTEEISCRNGKVLTANLVDYKAPTSADLPAIEPILVEPGDPVGPFGAKGIGEPSIVPTAAAIANAVFDATGVRIKRLPLRPEKVFWAINKES